ncbi:MAG: ferrous iron transport protein A [Planctomycetes bacterium]|nr:ferrous iron transport protein A [Planctomycetota bacterium]
MQPDDEAATADRLSLADLRVGQRGVVRRFRCTVPLMQRLLEMGLTPGVAVDVIRLAPLGDPLQVRLRGYYLSLRKAEAKLIDVTLESHP